MHLKHQNFFNEMKGKYITVGEYMSNPVSIIKTYSYLVTGYLIQ